MQRVTIDNLAALKSLLEFWQSLHILPFVFSYYASSYNHNQSMFSYSLTYVMFSSFGQ